MDALDKQVLKDIDNKSYLKAINVLNAILTNDCKDIVISTTDGIDLNDIRVKYLLIRGYCYHRLATKEAMDLALNDVLMAINSGVHRFQPFLLGAVLLLDMKRYEESLSMFETSMQLNDNLFNLLVNTLNYLKFKVLSERGFDEQLSLTYAMEYRYLEQCVAHMPLTSDRTDPLDANLLSLIVDNKRMAVKDNGLEPMANTSSSRSRCRSFSEVVNSNEFQPLNELLVLCGRQRPHIAPGDHYAKGDRQQFTRRVPNEVIVDSLAIDSSKCKPNDRMKGIYSEDSLDMEFKESLHINESSDVHKISNTSDEWIDMNTNADNVSKMCSFDDNMAEWISVGSRVDKKAYNRPQKELAEQTVPTNIFKLRGLYVGNLRINCDQKSLRESFKTYGTIVEIYQPSGECYAFIHFNACEPATRLLAEWNHKPHPLCKDGKCLVIRFTASQDQMCKYNAIPYDEYKKRCHDVHECELWRSGDRCPNDNQQHPCSHRHIPVCRSIDTRPDQRKANWKLF